MSIPTAQFPKTAKETGQPPDFGDLLASFMQFKEFIVVDGYRNLEQEYQS